MTPDGCPPGVCDSARTTRRTTAANQLGAPMHRSRRVGVYAGLATPLLRQRARRAPQVRTAWPLEVPRWFMLPPLRHRPLPSSWRPCSCPRRRLGRCRTALKVNICHLDHLLGTYSFLGVSANSVAKHLAR
jgi:hypothetical protein